MIAEEFKKIISERIYISKTTDDEWDYGINKCCERLINLVSDNLEESIDYIKNDCTADEFSYLSEVMEEIAEKTQSQEFIDVLYETAKKYPEECKDYNILSFIKDAEELIAK
ncbi:MAG: hypothetical protein IKI30_03580 [Oxalobacter sp.]|nr:hypothetical protein [Oxalobacter sp.]